MAPLFPQIVFGPIKSRRLGLSLGINLFPADAKTCTFECVYCECGHRTNAEQSKLPSPKEVKKALEEKLNAMKAVGEAPDVITFSGNGEPTMHPQFGEVVEDTIFLRDRYFPKAKVCVLSNSTLVEEAAVFEALKKVDRSIMKLDSAIDSTVQLINQPLEASYTVAGTIESLKKFEGRLFIQTMFLRGKNHGHAVDNTTEEEIKALRKAFRQISPRQIMIYSLDRPTAEKTLEKVSAEELDQIAERFREDGFDVLVAG